MFKLSINEKFIILTTTDTIEKINISGNGKKLEFVKSVVHKPGKTGNISFKQDDSYFISGGDQTSDLIIYDSKNLEVLYLVE